MPLRLSLSIALFVSFGALAAHAATSEISPPDVIVVTMDQAKIAKIPEGTVTLVIGNPIVADVTELKSSSVVVVTGKGFGETNLLSLDAQGRVLEEKTVRVTPTHGVIVVQHGTLRLSYSCHPICMPTVQIGDDPKSFDAGAGQITAHSGLALAGAVAAPTPH